MPVTWSWSAPGAPDATSCVAVFRLGTVSRSALQAVMKTAAQATPKRSPFCIGFLVRVVSRRLVIG